MADDCYDAIDKEMFRGILATQKALSDKSTISKGNKQDLNQVLKQIILRAPLWLLWGAHRLDLLQ